MLIWRIRHFSIEKIVFSSLRRNKIGNDATVFGWQKSERHKKAFCRFQQ